MPSDHKDSDAIEAIDKALDIIEQFGGTDGSHHKAWVIDQIARILIGDPERYNAWVKAMKAGAEGPNTYEWDEGIPP